MADFLFLRLEKVNVMRYLPKFLAGDMSFKDVQDTFSTEHERYRLLLPEITKQFFIETATWGLPSWEDVYQTNPPYEGGDAYVEEDVAPGSFRLHCPSIILWQEQLEEALDAAVPAHLMYDLHFEKDKADAVLYYASAPSIHTTYEIRPAQITDATTEGGRHIGAAVSTHTTYKVYPCMLRDASQDGALYAGSIGNIYKVLEVTQT